MRGFDFADFLGALVNTFLLRGALVTAGLAAAGLVGGLALGLLIALLRASGFRVASGVARFYIWFFRGTPLLIQLVMIYSGLPQIGIKFGVLTSVIIALVLNEAAYMAEIMRSGFLAVPQGQRDAAMALGLSPLLTLRKVAAAAGGADHPAGVGKLGERVAEGDVGDLRHLDGGVDAAQRDDHAGEVRRVGGICRSGGRLPGADDIVGPGAGPAGTAAGSRAWPRATRCGAQAVGAA